MLEAHDQIAVNTLFILFLIMGFGFWVIKKHYDNAFDIEQLQIQMKKAREKELSSYPKGISLNDLKKMQNDIIEQNQNCINLNAKINRNEKWTVETIDKIKKAIDMLGEIQSKLVAFMDSCEIPSDGDVINIQDVLDKMEEMGVPIPGGRIVSVNPDEEANA